MVFRLVKKPIYMKTIILVSTVIILFSCTSCKKSSHCIVKDNSGNVIKDYGAKTGTSTDVKNYENSCKSDAQQYNGTITCNN